MHNKKILIPIISVLFAVIVVIAVVFAFSVSEIRAEFTLSDGEKRAVLDEKLEKFIGKNLLFFNTEEIEESINSDPYTECVSVKKVFPNALSVSVKERRAVYIVEYEGQSYLTSENGFVLEEYGGEKTRDYISLSLSGITLKKPETGRFITAEEDSYISTAFDMAKTLNLTDIISEMKIEKTGAGNLVYYNAEFYTYTEVKIKIDKFNEKGEEKARKAFDVYNAEKSDYVKTFYSIEAYEEVGGAVVVVWTRYGE